MLGGFARALPGSLLAGGCLRTSVLVWPLGTTSLLALLVALGCGGGEGGSTSAGQGGAAGASSGTQGGGNSGSGGSLTCTGAPTSGLVLAANTLSLGDETPEAWRQFGFNLDGLVGTGPSQNACQPQGGAASAEVHDDGDNGIDNSFGRNVLPLLSTVVEDASADVNEAILEGGSTLVVYLEGLGNAPTQNMIPARVYTGAQTPAAPLFQGGDCWPVDPVSLQTPGALELPTISYPQSLVVNQEWSGGAVAQGPLTLRLMLGGHPLVLPLRQVRLLFELTPTRDGAVNGRLGGMLLLEEMEEAFRRFLGGIDGALCDEAAVATFLQQLRETADLLATGVQDPDEVCDAISVGLGFTMAPVKLGSIAPPVAVDDPCGP